nr:hypothetical protein [Tanacetum cinerariifolium]
FDGKEHDFDAKKHESEVNVSPSNKYRDLSGEFEDCSNNSSNEVHAAGSIVLTVGQNSLNNTNSFSTAGPSNAAVSPTYGKYSFIDASQLPDDLDMLEFEDITYSDDEDVVGAEADFNNLESSIPVKQKKDGIFISQDKYVAEILRMFGLTEGKLASTPIDTEKPLLKDPDGEDVDVHTYRSMIGSLMYLTSSRPDIMFAFWNTVVIKHNNDVTRLQALVDKKKVVVIEAAIREVLRLDDAEGVDCLPNEEIFVELARMGYEKPSTKLTFYKAFFSSQWKFHIHTIL